RTARGVLRWSQRVDDDGALVGEAEHFAEEAAGALGLDKAVVASFTQPVAAVAAPAAPLQPDVHFNLKLGNTLSSLHGASLSAFNVRFDLEGDYYFSPRWQAFLQAGIVVGSASDATGTEPGERTFRLFPAFAGLKYTFRAEQDLRPYVSAGVGMSIVNKLFQKSDTSGITTQGVLGLA